MSPGCYKILSTSVTGSPVIWPSASRGSIYLTPPRPTTDDDHAFHGLQFAQISDLGSLPGIEDRQCPHSSSNSA